MGCERLMFVLLTILSVTRLTLSGFCTQSKSCTKQCSTKTKYYTACGLFDWERCTKSRTKYYSCSYTCYSRVCCAGYRGTDCNIPICQPECLNEGLCTSPDKCLCRPGFREPYCDDIDECTDGTAECGHECTNTLGSFKCSCRTGFELSYDQTNCTDIDECFWNRTICEGTCSNTDGSFVCGCSDGYALDTDGRTCKDIDECDNRTDMCTHSCNNTIGSYKCLCKDGFYLAQDQITCLGKEERIEENKGIYIAATSCGVIVTLSITVLTIFLVHHSRRKMNKKHFTNSPEDLNKQSGADMTIELKKHTSFAEIDTDVSTDLSDNPQKGKEAEILT